MTSIQHLLVIGGGREVPGLALGAKPGLKLSVFCRAEVLPRVRTIEDSERTMVFRDDSTAEEWVQAAKWVHSYDPIDYVATYSEKDQDKAAAIGAALNLRAPSPDTVRFVHDKYAMRQVLCESGVDGTRAIEAVDAASIAQASSELGYPLIIKPVRGVASRGIFRATDSAELDAGWKACIATTDVLDEPRVLIEEFIEGDEYSVESFSEFGVHRIFCIVQKFKDLESFVEVGHALPAKLDRDVEQAISGLVHNCLDAVGVEDGVTHTEVIYNPLAGRAHIVELHLRPAGDEIPEMVKDALGVDLVLASARQSVGFSVLAELESALLSGPTSCEAIAYSMVPASGELVAIHGVEEARAREGVRDVEMIASVGDTLKMTADSRSRLAWVRAHGESSESAYETAKGALAQLRWTIITGAQ